MDSTKDRYLKVQAAVANGAKVVDALKEHKLASASYYTIRKSKKFASNPKKIKRKYNKNSDSVAFIDPVHPITAKVAVIVCDLANVKEVLSRLS